LSQNLLNEKSTIPLASYFHVHLVSDSTGETLNAVLKAVTSQFAIAKPLEHINALVRSEAQLNRALKEIEESPGIVLYTIMNPNLRRRLELRCSELQVPAVPVLDPFLNAFAQYLGLEQSGRAGAQHDMDDAYFKRHLKHQHVCIWQIVELKQQIFL